MKSKPVEKYFLSNNLYSEQLIGELPQLLAFDEDISNQFSEIKQLYKKEKFKSLNEAQLEKNFIEPVLRTLGWSCLYQEFKKFHGKTERPDFCLFESHSKQDEYLQIKQEDRYFRNDGILLVCESKAYEVPIDNKKIKDNPHFQIIEYLTYLRINFGFLTNGRNWRLYDLSKASGDKKFYEINLESIIENDDLEAFKYFFHLFKKDNFIQKAEQESLIEKVSKREESFRLDIESNLKSVIYGYDNEDSIFELIGKQIFKTNPEAKLEEVYENSLYLIFRLLFIAYFEDKFAETLTKHKHYNEYSLTAIYQFLQTNNDSSYTAYRKLRELFQILDRGDEAIEIPLFNGGLFDPTRARFLDQAKLIDNQSLYAILNGLYFVRKAGQSLFKRDFKTLNISHLGTIYEGLLEFRFEVAQEDLVYLEYGEKGSKSKKLSGYFDTYDYADIEQKNKIFKSPSYKKGELYLVSSSNSRKSSASYYTPSSLSKWMVKEAIDKELERSKDVFNIRILDNSCGSGHFLVEALDYLCEKTLLLSSDNEQLNKLIEDEKQRIQENLIGFEELPDIDEQAILKRLLLKKTIFGVDYNPFAIELTKLSLWISTFIFGTPLGFIEHHIKVGNSLIGGSIDEAKEHWGASMTLFDMHFLDQLDDLKDIVDKLDHLNDTTEEEIKKSKEIYSSMKKPFYKVNRILNFLTYKKFKEIEKDKASLERIKIHGFNLLDENFVEKFCSISDLETLEDLTEKFGVSLNKDLLKLEQEVLKYTKEYKFFNYEIEFPEAFQGENKGFQIVIGNPPWDKTKFSDMDFFSQYVTNYRILPNSKKAQIQADWLAKDWVKAKYHKEEKQVLLTNEFYKKNYPFNQGAGDGNLFRFFVERNLTLLAKTGTLNYVLPSALMFEDGSMNLRKHIFANYKINHFHSFENRQGIFPEVDDRYKFAVIQIENTQALNQSAKTQFMKLNPACLYDETEIIDYGFDLVENISPDHFAYLELKDKKDINIIKKAYSLFPKLNPEYIDFRNELHMTNDKDIFEEKYSEGVLPLYQGGMIHQFNSKYAEPKYWVKLINLEERLRSREIYRLVNDIYTQISNNSTQKSKESVVLENLKLKDKSSLEKFIQYDNKFFKLAVREIARDTDERTLISSLTPRKVTYNNKLFISMPKNYTLSENKVVTKVIPVERILFTNTLFNSLFVDYILRFFVQITVSKTYLMRLPIPQPSDEELESNEDYKKLILNALKLTLHYNWDDFVELADQFNLTKEDIPKTQKQVDLMKIENDCIVAKLYQITHEELVHICSSFKVLNNKNPSYTKTLIERYKA